MAMKAITRLTEDLPLLRILWWKYAPGSYTLWRELPFKYSPVFNCNIQFSPTRKDESAKRLKRFNAELP